MNAEYVQISSTRVISIESYTSIALDTAVHFVFKKGPKVLTGIGPLLEPKFSPRVAGHHGHVLQMAFPAFIADGTVVRMVRHEPLNDSGAKLLHFRIVDGNAHSILSIAYAGHDNLTASIFLVSKQFDCTLPACAYGMHGRMPAEIRNIETQGEAGVQKILTVFNLIRFVVDVNDRHIISRDNGVLKYAVRNLP
jgi:hypothetical protein